MVLNFMKIPKKSQQSKYIFFIQSNKLIIDHVYSKFACLLINSVVTCKINKLPTRKELEVRLSLMTPSKEAAKRSVIVSIFRRSKLTVYAILSYKMSCNVLRFSPCLLCIFFSELFEKSVIPVFFFVIN